MERELNAQTGQKARATGNDPMPVRTTDTRWADGFAAGYRAGWDDCDTTSMKGYIGWMLSREPDGETS